MTLGTGDDRSGQSMFLGTNNWQDSQYQDVLVAWAAQTGLPTIAEFDFGDTKYELGGPSEAAKNTLVAAGWTIADGGGI